MSAEAIACSGAERGAGPHNRGLASHPARGLGRAAPDGARERASAGTWAAPRGSSCASWTPGVSPLAVGGDPRQALRARDSQARGGQEVARIALHFRGDLCDGRPRAAARAGRLALAVAASNCAPSHKDGLGIGVRAPPRPEYGQRWRVRPPSRNGPRGPRKRPRALGSLFALGARTLPCGLTVEGTLGRRAPPATLRQRGPLSLGGHFRVARGLVQSGADYCARLGPRTRVACWAQ